MFSVFRVSRLLVACLLVGWFGHAKANVVLQLSSDSGGNSILTGANGVSVDGKLYDVQFKTGSCIGQFGGCVQSAFTFTTTGSAVDASNALLSQVFVGTFNSLPDLTAGCTLLSPTLTCATLTPFEINANDSSRFDAGVAYNLAGNQTDLATDAYRYLNSLTANESNAYTFALWSPVPATVPEPDPLALLGLGLVSLVLSSLRSKTVSDA